jgi:uncharacterized protein (UPF0276 family)
VAAATGVVVAAAAAVAVAAAGEIEMARNPAIAGNGPVRPGASPAPDLGLGIGWRPELAWLIDRHPGLGFVEVIAEDHDPRAELPEALGRLRERGVAIVPHGVSLSLAGAARPDRARLKALGKLAERLGAPLVSEHVAFVRAGDLESGHLLPPPRTRAALDVLVANVREAQDGLPVPLALENIATLLAWPGPEMTEAEFLTELLDRTGAWLLLDVANVHANVRNHGGDALEFFRELPLDRLAYVHVAGGVERDGIYHDTHAAPTAPAVLQLLEALAAVTRVPGALLERDDRFPPDSELRAELEAIAAALARGASRRDQERPR